MHMNFAAKGSAEAQASRFFLVAGMITRRVKVESNDTTVGHGNVGGHTCRNVASCDL